MSKSWKIGSLVNVIFCRLNLELHCFSGERVALKLPSRLCIKFRWSGVFILNGVQFSSQEEFVNSSCGQSGRELSGQLHSAFVAIAAGTWVKINLKLNCEYR